MPLHLTDNDFHEYLKSKYGSGYPLTTLFSNHYEVFCDEKVLIEEFHFRKCPESKMYSLKILIKVEDYVYYCSLDSNGVYPYCLDVIDCRTINDFTSLKEKVSLEYREREQEREQVTKDEAFYREHIRPIKKYFVKVFLTLTKWYINAKFKEHGKCFDLYGMFMSAWWKIVRNIRGYYPNKEQVKLYEKIQMEEEDYYGFCWWNLYPVLEKLTGDNVEDPIEYCEMDKIFGNVMYDFARRLYGLDRQFEYQDFYDEVDNFGKITQSKETTVGGDDEHWKDLINAIELL